MDVSAGDPITFASVSCVLNWASRPCSLQTSLFLPPHTTCGALFLPFFCLWFLVRVCVWSWWPPISHSIVLHCSSTRTKRVGFQLLRMLIATVFSHGHSRYGIYSSLRGNYVAPVPWKSWWVSTLLRRTDLWSKVQLPFIKAALSWARHVQIATIDWSMFVVLPF